MTAREFRARLDCIDAIRSRVYEALFYALAVVGIGAALGHAVCG